MSVICVARPKPAANLDSFTLSGALVRAAGDAAVIVHPELARQLLLPSATYVASHPSHAVSAACVGAAVALVSLAAYITVYNSLYQQVDVSLTDGLKLRCPHHR